MSNYDEIRLIGIGGYGYHGALASERQEGQPFHADVVLYLDTAAAARTDELGHTADYSAVAKAVVEVIEGEPANLIETLAARIADVALGFGAAKVDVTLHKPQAPLGVPFSDVQVHVSRTAPTGASMAPADGGEQAPLEQEPELPPVPAVAPPPLPPAVAPMPDPLAGNEGIPAQAGRSGLGQLDAVPDEPVPVVLGIGGNLGDVRQTLRDAVEDLTKASDIQVTDVSALARTAAVPHNDDVAQNDYLNAVVLAETTLSPRGLLAEVHKIEDAHGRVRVERWGDRTLDIDIITYGDVSSSEPDLTLPHPRASQRAFVLVPWAQVDPQAHILGADGGVVAELADSAPDRSGVRWLALDWLEEGHQKTDIAPQAPAPKCQDAAPEEDEPEPPRDEEPGNEEPGEGDAPEAAPRPTSPFESPGVAEWLDAKPVGEPDYADAQPAVPVPPPAADADEPSQEVEAESESGGVDWLDEKAKTPPLEASPQWLKVRRDE